MNASVRRNPLVEQCFLCSKSLTKESDHCIKCTKIHLDNYERHVQKHEIYKHFFKIRSNEYFSIEGQVFTTCSRCFEGVDELLFIENQMEELGNQMNNIIESLTAEILLNRNKCSENAADPLSLDQQSKMKPLKAEVVFSDLTEIVNPKIEVDIHEDFDFHCPSSPEQWINETDNEQNCLTPQEKIEKVAPQQDVEFNAAESDDIWAEMSKREIRIVLQKLETNFSQGISNVTSESSILKEEKPSSYKTMMKNHSEIDFNKEDDFGQSDNEFDEKESDEESDDDFALEDDDDSDFRCNLEDTTKRKRKRKCRKTSVLTGEAQILYDCEICGDKVKPLNLRNFRKHIVQHPNYKPFKCKFPNCEMKFRYGYSLQIHEKEHLGKDEGYECDICGNLYRGPYELRKHKQRVHVETEEICKICGKKYKLKQNLMVHVKRFHGISHLEYADKNSVTPFCCNICQQYYSTENILEAHNNRFHTVSVDFFCKFCKVNVTPVKSLTYINTGKKKLHTIGNIIKCSRRWCTEKFNCTENYNHHKRSHHMKDVVAHRSRKGNVKPFKCEVCNTCFSQHRRLLKHTKRFHPEKDALPIEEEIKKGLTCEVCEKVYTRKGELQRHIKMRHKKKDE